MDFKENEEDLFRLSNTFSNKDGKVCKTEGCDCLCTGDLTDYCCLRCKTN